MLARKAGDPRRLKTKLLYRRDLRLILPGFPLQIVGSRCTGKRAGLSLIPKTGLT
jgi:hypothetical protein